MEEGLELDLTGHPPIYRLARPVREFATDLDLTVHEYLQRGVIAPSEDPEQRTFPFFLIRQGEKLRPILDLRPLNQWVRYVHFKMEGIPLARAMIRQNDWMAKIDLKDAYQSVPLARSAQKLMGFAHQGKNYKFLVMPFGLSSAPRVFTKLMSAALTPLRAAGMRLVYYLDDILVLGRTQREAAEHCATLWNHLSTLGLTVNEKKSSAPPAQNVKFLGMEFDSCQMTVSVPSEKLRKVKQELTKLLETPRTKLRKLAAIAGTLASFSMGFLPAFIHQRCMQQNIILFGKRKVPWDHEVPIFQRTKREIKWWISHMTQFNGRPIVEEESNAIHIYTDASKTGWGCAAKTFSEVGFWDDPDQALSSNFRELKAIYLTLRTRLKELRNQTVIIHSDNTTSIAQINGQSSPRHPHLLRIAKQIWNLVLRNRIQIHAVHVRGGDNVDADLLSRLSPEHEWMLSPTIFQGIANRLGPCEVDLFASSANAQTSTFVTRHHCPQAMATDALRMSAWPQYSFANPPPILIPRVLQRLQGMAHPIVLLTPAWPSQPWWPEWVRIARKKPWIIAVKKSTASLNGHAFKLPFQNLAVWKLFPAA